MRRGRRHPGAIIGAWLAALLMVGLWSLLNLRLDADLSLFLPSGASEPERVLLAQLRSGLAAQTLLIRISGAHSTERLAAASQALAARLHGLEGLRQVANGDPSDLLTTTDETLFRYRYLIGPAEVCVDALDAAGLRSGLEDRLAELVSGVGLLAKRRVAADPTACYRQLLLSLRPEEGPNRLHGAWLSAAGEAALLVVVTSAEASDTAAQRQVIERIRAAFAALPDSAGLELELTGPGYFAATSERHIQTETRWLSAAATLLVAAILALALRSLPLLLLGLLPVLSGVMVGAALVALLYGYVHGIALALGTTLLGVTLDYPIHVSAHTSPGDEAGDATPPIWRELLLGMVTTVLGYASLAWTHFDGLAQLGVFAAGGLLTAALTSRYLLPLLLPHGFRPAEQRWLVHLNRWQPRLRGWTGAWLLFGVLAVLGSVIMIAQAHLETDIRKLSVVPATALERDRQIRQELGAPDVARLLYVTAPEQGEVLSALEAVQADLAELREAGLIDGFETVVRWLPSPASQHARQARLPPPAELEQALVAANAELPFRRETLGQFLSAVETARTLPPLTAAALAETFLGPRTGMLLSPFEGGWLGVVALRGADHAGAEPALVALAERSKLVYLDLRAGTAELLRGFIAEALKKLLIAAGVILVVLAVALRSPTRLLRIIGPTAIAVAASMTVVLLVYGAINLFHLISLLLVAGLAIDYSLFLSRPIQDASDRARTLFSVSVSAASTLAMFAILALSAIPALRAIGLTAAAGIIAAYLAALLVARTAPGHTARHETLSLR